MKITQLKIAINNMKKSCMVTSALEGLTLDKRFPEFTVFKTIQSKCKEQLNEQCFRNVWNNNKICNIFIIYIHKGEEKVQD